MTNLDFDWRSQSSANVILHFKKCRFLRFFLRNNDIENLQMEDCTVQNGKLSYMPLVHLLRTEITGTLIIEELEADVTAHDCRFNGLLLYRGDLHSLKVFDSEIKHLNVEEARFADSLYLDRCRFQTAPRFHLSELPVDTSFQGSKFLDTNLKAEAKYRHLASLLKKIGNDADYYQVAGSELAARHSRLKKAAERPLAQTGIGLRLEYGFSGLYRAINDFGRDFSRPLFWLVPLFLVNLALHEVSFHFADKAFRLADTAPKFSWSWGPLLISLWTAFVGILGPFRFYGPLAIFEPGTALLAFSSTATAILSTLLWYLFIVGLRRQFRT